MRHLPLISLLAVSLLLFSCKKDDPLPEPPLTGDLIVNLSHHVDGAPVQWNSVVHENEAGFSFSVTRLQYFLSGFKLIRNGGGFVAVNSVVYVDAQDPTTLSFVLRDLPEAEYTGIEFHVGLDSTRNVSNSLPATLENFNMAWPDLMGGGYHFMKFEGTFLDSAGLSDGFAMHLGMNGNESHCFRHQYFSIANCCQANLDLRMNVNEWFRNPHVYDFAVDGASIMSNPASLAKLSENGDDVFSE